jgi:hypothetical protein
MYSERPDERPLPEPRELLFNISGRVGPVAYLRGRGSILPATMAPYIPNRAGDGSGMELITHPVYCTIDLGRSADYLVLPRGWNDSPWVGTGHTVLDVRMDRCPPRLYILAHGPIWFDRAYWRIIMPGIHSGFYTPSPGSGRASRPICRSGRNVPATTPSGSRRCSGTAFGGQVDKG